MLWNSRNRAGEVVRCSRNAGQHLSRDLRDKLRFALLLSVVISFLFTYSLALMGLGLYR
ncbi:MAG: hypothetical protein LBP35_06620 [Candidatus Ancillula trichonymphae]|jgi:hypothetical protein|nr:hypothetical protein [Candidatus Ancillula trichonymphae]